MIYFEEPKEFNSKFDVVSCFLEFQGKFLLLRRQDYKPQGNTWGVPAGKVEKNEKPLDGMIREFTEETGCIPDVKKFNFIKTIYVKYPEYDFVYHMYEYIIVEPLDIKIDPVAHKDYKWVDPQEALEMNCIQDLDVCIKIKYNLF